MSQTRTILCGEAAADRRGQAEDVLRLKDSGKQPDVHLHIDDIARSLSADVPQQFADLIEIATYVYVADQAHTRGGAGVENMGAEWRRKLHFEVPVRCPDLWSRPEVSAALCEALNFLSEDEYTFAFRLCRRPRPFTRFLNYADFDEGFKPERVVMFSGGLDSLGGAVVETVIEGRPVVLVTHQSTRKFINRLRTLRQMLDGRAKGPRPLHATVEINKSEALNHEYTQRSRSFLYASLGATIAQMCGLSEVRFYENGTVSLNLPISRQVVGAKATRTTHPRVLAGFRHLLSLVAGRSVEVTNDFLWKTKGEVVELILKAGCGGMIEWSTSCTHTWDLSNAKPHCGKCSQCIDRRFAVLAAGAGHFERADTYGVDLLTDPRDAGEPRTMLASYVETAQQVAAMSETEFFVRYGEVGRIVRQIGGSADENARKIYDLYRRHAREVVKVVDHALAEYVPQIRARSLPESCLLRLVHDPSVPGGGAGSAATEEDSRRPPEPEYMLRPCGQGWQLRFAGHETQWLLPAIGLAYLREVLRFPEKSFTVSELLIAVHGQKAALPLGDAGGDLDDQAKRAYAHHLGELEQELDEARDDGDLARQERLARERQQFLEHFKVTGLLSGGKRASTDLDRLRNSVGNAIRRALDTIAKYEPAGFAHLKSSLSLGYTVTYRPAEPIRWDL